jgi:hypothetical protein
MVRSGVPVHGTGKNLLENEEMGSAITLKV